MADRLLERGDAELRHQRAIGAVIDPVAAGFLVYEQADRLFYRGRIAEAQALFEEAAELAKAAGKEVSVAVAVSRIAEIFQRRGETGEALRMLQEDVLPVFERLGDIRLRAAALDTIAQILFSLGEIDEALRIRQQEELPVYARLGDAHSRAVTWGSIADIFFSRGELDEALRIRQQEELPVYDRLDDVRSRAMTLGKIADIFFRRGQLDEALRIHREEELPVYDRLDDRRSRTITLGRIANILAKKDDLKGARALHEERLEILRELEDPESIAAALWDLSVLDIAEKDFETAGRRIPEAYAIMLHVGRAEGIAEIGKMFGPILAAGNQREKALEVLRRSAEMFRKLGREAEAQSAESIIGQFGLS
jgi:tetratricopeptide (TPR) repeat protein